MANAAHFNLPPSGSLIRLAKPPAGSYATAGETYRVTYQASQRRGVKGIWPHTSVSLWSEARDCGTVDSAGMWRASGAAWEALTD